MTHAIGPIAVRRLILDRLPRHPPLAHTDHVLTYVAAGSLRMDQGGSLQAEAGSLMILPAGAPHEPLEGRGLDLWSLRFCPSCFGLDETQPLMSPFRRVRHGALPVVSVARARRRRVVQLYRDLDREQGAALPESPDLLRAMIQVLLAEVHRAMPASGARPERSTSFVPEALTFIQRRALEPISLRDVAAAVGRAPAHVAATVKERTGHTVGAWITSVRLAESVSRLVHTDASVAEITERVGWHDQTHFIRQFRKAFGVTPAAWRGQQRGGHRDRVFARAAERSRRRATG
ncbi:MAG TPA: AraC family transcriptional regulator [Anaeromyxobacteraceae bacterium]|nr:AraC family transcriptional regulator [Anaeromyxobacteraceae bacterium]